MFYQRDISDLETGNLVNRVAQLFQEIHRRLIERRGKTRQPLLPRYPEQLLVPFPGCVSLLVQVIQVFSIPQRPLLDLEIISLTIQRYRVRRVRLQFNGIRSGSFGSLYRGYCRFLAPVMIRRQFRDNKYLIHNTPLVFVLHLQSRAR